MYFKKTLLILFLTIITTKNFSQPIIKNQKTIGGTGTDDFYAMALTKDGGVLVGGSSDSNSSNEKSENSRGARDYWIVKLDRNRQIMWDKTIGGSGDDVLRSIVETNDGGFLLGGYSGSNVSGEKSQHGRGSGDFWIVKLDSIGNIEWDKTIGGASTDDLYCITKSNDNGYLLGGYSYSNISGEKTQNTRGSADYWVVKINNRGKIEWDKTFGGSANEIVFAVDQTIDSKFILVGESSSDISGEKTQNSRGLGDFWIIKIDEAGNIEWDKTYGGNNSDRAITLSPTSDNAYVIGGYSSSNISGEKTENSRGSADYWLIKINSSGDLLWNKTIGGDKLDQLFSMQETIDKGFILGGYSSSNIAGEKTENSKGKVDYWIVKTDAAGNFVWDKTIGGDKSEGNNGAVAEVSRNTYMFSGSSFSGISGDKTEPSRGNSDFWTMKIKYQSPIISSVVSDVQNIQKQKESFTIYPNPANSILHIKTNSSAFFSLSDQSGKVLIQASINGAGTINTSAFSKGLYYLKNMNSGEVQKVFFIK